MDKNYQQPKVAFMKFKEDVIRTSTPEEVKGVKNFNTDWISAPSFTEE